MGSPPNAGPEDYYRPGDWNIICSVCGTKLKFGNAIQHWSGTWRCSKCWEPRQPQDFVTALDTKEMAIPVVQKDTEIDVVAPTFPASGAIVSNTFATAVNVAIFPQGVTVSQVKINGVAVELGHDSSDVIQAGSMPIGGTVQITYSGKGYPMWSWY